MRIKLVKLKGLVKKVPVLCFFQWVEMLKCQKLLHESVE